MSNMKPIPISFNEKQIKKLKTKSKETGESIASIVRRAVNKHLEI